MTFFDSLVGAWIRFGRLPSVGMYVAFLAVVGLLILLVGRDGFEPAGGVALLALILYCVARPNQRWDTFCMMMLPNCGGLLAELVGISPTWGLVLIPLALLMLRDIDRGEPA